MHRHQRSYLRAVVCARGVCVSARREFNSVARESHACVCAEARCCGPICTSPRTLHGIRGNERKEEKRKGLRHVPPARHSPGAGANLLYRTPPRPPLQCLHHAAPPQLPARTPTSCSTSIVTECQIPQTLHEAAVPLLTGPHLHTVHRLQPHNSVFSRGHPRLSGILRRRAATSPCLSGVTVRTESKHAGVRLCALLLGAPRRCPRLLRTQGSTSRRQQYFMFVFVCIQHSTRLQLQV